MLAHISIIFEYFKLLKIYFEHQDSKFDQIFASVCIQIRTQKIAHEYSKSLFKVTKNRIGYSKKVKSSAHYFV